MKQILILIASLFALSLSPLAATELPEVTEDGLHRVPDSRLAAVYAEPGADLKQYQRVRLDEAYVAFKKNWLQDQRAKAGRNLSVSSGDMERIKANVAEEFHEVFKETLQKGGYELADENADDVLLVRPAIVNLDVTAPERQSVDGTRSFSKSAGEMTLYIELYDSVTGDLIAKALDRQIDNPRRQQYNWTTSQTNKRAAKKIMTGWAETLVEALDEAHK